MLSTNEGAQAAAVDVATNRIDAAFSLIGLSEDICRAALVQTETFSSFSRTFPPRIRGRNTFRFGVVSPLAPR
jgi:hypothetical protein